MKNTLVSIFLTLLLISTFYLPNTFAQYQDYTQFSLPEGAKARIGKGWISGDIAHSPDGTRLAVSSSIGIWIYDANTFAEVALFTGHTAAVNSVAFSPDGKKLVSGSQDSTVRLWDVDTGQLLDTLEEHYDGVDDVAFSPDGKMFGSIDGKQEIRLWDADTFQLLHTLRDNSIYIGSVGKVNCLAFSSDSKMVAGGYYHGYIRFWDVSTGKYLGRANFSVYWGVNTVAFSSDGVTLAMGSGNDNVYLVGARTGKHWQTVGSHKGNVNSVAFSPDGKILASGGNDNQIKLWDAFTGEHLRTLEGHTSPVLSVSFSPDRKTLASASWTEIRFWDASPGQPLHTIDEHTRSVYTVALSPNDNILARGFEDGTIQLSNVTTGRHKWTLTGHTDLVRSVAFSPDGKTLASGGFDETARLWDVDMGEHKQTLPGHKDPVQIVVFSPNGETLASGSQDGTIRFWDTTTGEHKQTINPGFGDWVYSVDFSPDGQTFVSASAEKSSGGIYLWHLRTERRLRTLVSSTNTFAAAFSPDSSIIAGGVNNEIWLWDPRSGERLQKLTGHTDRVVSVAFSPDGQTLASGGFDQTIRLWDANTGSHLQTLIGHTDLVFSVDFSPDGSTLASGSADGTVLLWELTPSDTPNVPPDTSTTSNATVNISATPIQSPAIGELLTFPLNITDGENVAGYQATVQFDATALQYVKSANGDFLPAGAFFVLPVVEGNKVTLAASSLAGESNGDGTLATLTFELVAAKTSTLTLSEVSLVDSDGTRSHPNTEENTQIEIIEVQYAPEDIDEDGVVNILDLVAVASNFGETGENSADVNEDGVVDIVDLVLVAGAIGNTAGAPSVWDRDLEVVPTRTEVQQWLTQAQRINLTDATSRKGIFILEQLLAALTPKETSLLPNYPNPFNPETWIPYQLAESTEVSISIYAADGKLVQTLNLGHQVVGIYESRSRAAHWDGKNAQGESVASGVYFYTLTAGKFIATRKMLIMK